MARVPDISEAEWKVMKLLWEKSPQAAYDLSEQLGRQEGWSASTVKTLLSRLHKKGAVTVERYKNLFLYEPKVTEAECAAREADSLVERVFGGALEPLLMHFAKRRKLGPAEIADLKRILGEESSPEEVVMNPGGALRVLVDWVLQASWQVSWLVLLVAVVRWAGRGWLSPAWRHALWFPVVLRLGLPMAPASGLSLYRIIPSWHGMGAPALEGTPAVVAVPEQRQVNEERGVAGAARAGSAVSAETSRSTGKGVAASTPRRGVGVGSSVEPWFFPAGGIGPGPGWMQPGVTVVPAGRRFGDWRRWVGGVWFGGMAAASGVLFAAYGRLAWRLSRRSEIGDPRARRIWRECGVAMGVRREVRLVVASEVGSPALFGFWRCCLLLPPGLVERFSDAELRHVFLHELAHVRRGDVTVNGILAVLQVVHWFNPMVWWAFGRMRADRELATDALALTKAGEQEARWYGSTVIKVLEGAGTATMTPGLVGILEDRREVADRIRSIAAFRPRPRWSWLALGVVVAIAVLGLTDPRDSGAGARAEEPRPLKGGERPLPEAPPTGLPPEAKGRAVSVVVVDAATDAPVAGAEVLAPNEVAFHGRGSGGPRWVTDAAGRVEIRLGEVSEQPAVPRTWFAMSVRAPGYAGQGESWGKDGGDVRGEIPERIEVRLRRGGKLAGVLRDVGGRPLSGIRVTAWGTGYQYQGSNLYRQTYPEYWRTLGDAPAAVADAEGRWELSDVPLDLPSIVLECRRPDGSVQSFVHAREDRNPNLEAGGTPVRLEDLRRGNAVLVMAEGHTIRGRVVSPEGKPLAGVRVVEAHGVLNLYRDGAMRTDGAGGFTLSHRPAREIILTADAPGYALTSRVVPMAGDGVTSDVELRVASLAPLTIRVRDEAGVALAATDISVSTMRTEGQVLEFAGKTDGEGKVVWTNAPSAPVVLVATLPTLNVARKFHVGPEQRDVGVTLRRGMNREVVVRGRVVDATSGAPLEVSAAWVLTKPWEMDANETAPAMEPEVPLTDGFEVRVPASHWSAGGMYPSYRVKIRVPRYGVWLSAERDFDEGDWDLTVRLERESEKGPLRILLADGQPAAGARVRVQSSESHWLHLMDLEADLKVLRERRGSADFDFDADGEGRVTLPETLFSGGVVVTHEGGFASVKRSELRRRSEIRLQPWGRVEGIVEEGGRAVERRAVYLNSGELGLTPWTAAMRRVTDANGRFEFRTVPPGDAMVSLGLEPGFGPTTLYQQRPLVVESGRTMTVQMGGAGRLVLGRALGGWEWERDVHVLVLKSEMPEPEMARIENFATIAGFEKARDQWYLARHRHQREQRTHVLNFGAGGMFRVEDVPPGRYELRILVRRKLSESDRARMQEGQILARCVREVVVPPLVPGQSPDPVELGDLELTPEPGVPVPSAASAGAKTGGWEGMALSLEPFQGSYVLLRLTADWVDGDESSRAELEAFHRRHGAKPKWVALTWNLGDEPAAGRDGRGAGAGKTNWVEVRLTGREKVAALDILRVESLPMNLLLDPAGRELGRDSQLGSLMALLERRLVQTDKP